MTTTPKKETRLSDDDVLLILDTEHVAIMKVDKNDRVPMNAIVFIPDWALSEIYRYWQSRLSQDPNH